MQSIAFLNNVSLEHFEGSSETAWNVWNALKRLWKPLKSPTWALMKFPKTFLIPSEKPKNIMKCLETPLNALWDPCWSPPKSFWNLMEHAGAPRNASETHLKSHKTPRTSHETPWNASEVHLKLTWEFVNPPRYLLKRYKTPWHALSWPEASETLQKLFKRPEIP